MSPMRSQLTVLSGGAVRAAPPRSQLETAYQHFVEGGPAGTRSAAIGNDVCRSACRRFSVFCPGARAASERHDHDSTEE
jgi:hypothetical protein